jgi:hypothetical protein
MTNTTTHINHRYTFGNATAGERISEVVRHFTSETTKNGECGVTRKPYAIERTYEVATRIEQAPICGECLALAQA